MNKTALFLSAVAIILIAGIGYVALQNQIPGENPTSSATTSTDLIVLPPQETTFTTPPPPPTSGSPAPAPTPSPTPTPGKPIPTTNANVAPTDTTAVVTGTVNPNGANATYWYEYGTSPSLGNKTKAQVIGSGFSPITAPAYITGLTKDTKYYFKLVAQNQLGTVSGETKSFTTSSIFSAPVGSIPTVMTGTATGITENSATLKGTLNPNGASTKYWFEIGKDGTLGSVTIQADAGAGSANESTSVKVVGLAPATTYYYRINAQNQYGTINGAILTFKTEGTAASAKPVVTTQLATSVGTTTAVVAGTVNAYGAQTSYWFEYGTSSNFSQSKTTAKKSAGSGSSTQSVQATLTGLKSSTTYYVRIVAENSGGRVTGDSQTFQTK